MKGFSVRLIEWYNVNKRDLPWRETVDPYKVWLSEVILQQTRVDQGMSYYHKFLELFPEVSDLAIAAEDDVLKAWQGLGYYSRARNLHYTAKIIHHDLVDQFPKNAAALARLKGIGPYTASAIASFCFGESSAVIDGNVIRVISRFFAVYQAMDSKAGKSIIHDFANRLIDKKDPGTYNQAIMELGAMICTPFKPRCSDCPVSAECAAFKSDSVKIFPLKSKKTLVKDVWYYYFILQNESSVFLKKRTGEGIWRGLYDFPLVESDSAMSTEKLISDFIEKHELKNKMSVTSISEEHKHLLTHRRIHAVFIEIELRARHEFKDCNTIQIRKNRISEYGIPRLIDRYLRSSSEWSKWMA